MSCTMLPLKLYVFEKQRWTSGSKLKGFWYWGCKETLQERIIFVKFWNCLFETKNSLNYQTTIGILPKVYGTCFVKFTFWKQLLNSPSVCLTTEWKCLVGLFFLILWVLDEFKVDIMFALLASFTFFPHLSAPYVSFLTQMTLSAVHTSSVTNVFTFTISLLCFSHIYTQTHTHTPRHIRHTSYWC